MTQSKILDVAKRVIEAKEVFDSLERTRIILDKQDAFALARAVEILVGAMERCDAVLKALRCENEARKGRITHADSVTTIAGVALADVAALGEGQG